MYVFDYFRCLDGSCVSISLVCDLQSDCVDNSDESLCGKKKIKIYCKFRNFRVTFISRIFCFPLNREVLNSQTSVRHHENMSVLCIPP